MSSFSGVEKKIVTLWFHPRLVKSIENYKRECALTHPHHSSESRTQKRGLHHPDRSIEYALENPLERNVCLNTHAEIMKWMQRECMYVLVENCGIVDPSDSCVLAVDMMLMQSAEHDPTNAYLTLCTIIPTPYASADNFKSIIDRAHAHARKVHTIMNVSYHIKCNSVVLQCGDDRFSRFSETWL